MNLTADRSAYLGQQNDQQWWNY